MPSSALRGGGEQGIMSTHNVAQAWLLLFVYVVYVLHFQLNTSLPRRALGVVIFNFMHLSFSHLPSPTMPVVCGGGVVCLTLS